MRICAATGSRADWGLLKPVLARLRDADATLQIIATGSHLDSGFGHTVDSITEDGFKTDRRVALERSSDSDRGVADAMAGAVAGITRALSELAPDILLVLGDRYEIFAAAQAALLTRTPIAHIAGGDVSEGAYDDAMRHAITKLAHLHFTTNADAHRRVLQMGEANDRVILSGSPGIDALLTTPRWEATRLEERLGLRLRARNLAVTFHPATLDPASPVAQITPLLRALESFGDDTGLIFTGANADTGGTAINEAMMNFAASRDNACFHPSLGPAGYYSLVALADLVVGNSSSGLYEAPSLHTPTLDIGIRQQGRLRGASVHNVANDTGAIGAAIRAMLQTPPSMFDNPYGDGHAGERIANTLLALRDPRQLLHKHFVERRCD
ncbi:MAG: UDP-N-acetylglucosamine 2-epimerase (hydrolyzing) [Chromatiaceae bacterium]|nr:UDP-N-acetylglucosamine 2-epimerase (hydrolyzing) [Chromatiaceae bacterium]MCP5421472.1 UDP-N-acetylglucosamine 2-epimerase (hydrolyzing) [Chromatiaceae bacterium]